jgi:cytochrome c556
MIGKSFASRVIIGLAGSALLATVAFAGPIEDRQAAMKENGKMMGTLVAIIKGEATYDAAAVKTATDTMKADFEKFAASFPEGSDKGDVETWAKPEIWTDAAGFKKAMDDASAALAAVAASTDEASFKAAFPALGQACQSCHEKYRRPKG